MSHMMFAVRVNLPMQSNHMQFMVAINLLSKTHTNKKKIIRFYTFRFINVLTRFAINRRVFVCLLVIFNRPLLLTNVAIATITTASNEQYGNSIQLENAKLYMHRSQNAIEFCQKWQPKFKCMSKGTRKGWCASCFGILTSIR